MKGKVDRNPGVLNLTETELISSGFGSTVSISAKPVKEVIVGGVIRDDLLPYVGPVFTAKPVFPRREISIPKTQK